MVQNRGEALTDLLLNTIRDAFAWTVNELKQLYTDACVNGAYINVNMKDHLSNTLDLSLEFMNDSVIRDAAHRLELVCMHSTEGYKCDGQWVD